MNTKPEQQPSWKPKLDKDGVPIDAMDWSRENYVQQREDWIREIQELKQAQKPLVDALDQVKSFCPAAVVNMIDKAIALAKFQSYPLPEVVVDIGGTDFVFHPLDDYERHNLEVLVKDRDEWRESAAGYGADSEQLSEQLAAARKECQPLMDALKCLHRVDMTRSEMKDLIDAALAKAQSYPLPGGRTK